jgi:hypothetical protein
MILILCNATWVVRIASELDEQLKSIAADGFNTNLLITAGHLITSLDMAATTP